jgi:hypothetical protein
MKPLGDLPLFSYPRSPGYKEKTTSMDAARAMTSRASILRNRAFAEIVRAGKIGLTADEVAERLGETVLAVRPRVSELAKSTPPLVVPTGERRRNESSLGAKVWRAA